ncbi:MAG TPA: F0F1 ATP synthase subunit B [Gemmatimonadota bacterium]|jgi:F-type H+-transporting ATPase subunit b|nr:F0F1 ATP synthase subunit B [Gemmatimonadota bacterium]
MDLLSADPGLIVWTIVTFLLLLGILWKFAWNPILGALDAREQAIQKTIDDAERLQAEAEAVLQEHQKRLAEARADGNRIMEEARQAGEHMKQDILEKARSESEKVLERAHRQLELETEQAIQTIRAQAADLAIKVAEKVLERSLTDADHRRLADEAIAELVEGRS